MKCVLLALALVCAVQASIVPKPMADVDLHKLNKEWALKAIVTTNELLENEDKTPRTAILNVALKANDNLEITIAKWENNKCFVEKIMATATAVPSEFSFKYDHENIPIFISSLDEKHLTMCTRTTQGNPENFICYYLVSPQNLNNEEVTESVNEFAKVTDAVILDIRPNQAKEPCPHLTVPKPSLS